MVLITEGRSGTITQAYWNYKCQPLNTEQMETQSPVHNHGCELTMRTRSSSDSTHINNKKGAGEHAMNNVVVI